MKKQVICICCGGDGIETCNNPDHGFLRAFDGIGGRGANESACPCCGHDEDHKIKKYVDGKYVYSKCYECDGTGVLTEEKALELADEYGYDDELKYIEQ